MLENIIVNYNEYSDVYLAEVVANFYENINTTTIYFFIDAKIKDRDIKKILMI